MKNNNEKLPLLLQHQSVSKLLPKHWALLLLGVPIFFDSIGYGVLSFSELLTTSVSLGFVKSDDAINPNDFFPLLLLPFFAVTGTFILGAKENSQRVSENFSFQQHKIKQKFQDAWKTLKEYPLAVLCLLVGGFAEAIIVYNNLGTSINEIDSSFRNTSFYQLCSLFSLFVAIQFVLLNTSHLIKLINEGYCVGDYLNYSRPRFEQFLMLTIVNFLPILCSFTAGILAASESYQLADFVMQQLDREDIAARIAWFPAFIFGGLYFTCHFALYGREFKAYLAHNCQQINTQGWIKFIKNLKPSKERWRSKLFLYSLAGFISLSAAGIGFGALEEMCYIISYSESPTSQSATLSLTAQLFLFSLPAFSLALGTYAVEARKLLTFAKLVPEIQIPVNTKENSNTTYTIRKLIPDSVFVILIGSIKFLIDWVYMPDSVTANQLTFFDNVLIAAILGIIAMGRHGIVSYYQHLNNIENKNNNQLFNDKNSETTRQFLWHLFLVGFLTTFFTAMTELFTRNIFLNQAETDEAMDRLNNAQVMGAIVGGATSVYALPAAIHTKNQINRLKKNCYTFFKGKQNVDYENSANNHKFMINAKR